MIDETGNPSASSSTLRGGFRDGIGSLPAPGLRTERLAVTPEVLPELSRTLVTERGGRAAAVFAEDDRAGSGNFLVSYVFALPSEHAYAILEVPIAPERAEFPALSSWLPAVNWQEREVQDWMGLTAIGHPNPRRVALHDNWPDRLFPLRKDFDLRRTLAPFRGERHRYRRVEGEGVLHVPVGPVHAGIIEPGHFLFSVAGEPVLYLQIRLFYTHKGTEKLFETLSPEHGVFLAESISGDSSVSHGTAFCQAVEQAAGLAIPARARYGRTILLELERLYNHVADIGAIATDVGFAIANAHAISLKERILRLNEALTGNRLGRGAVCLGGLRRDWAAEHVALLSAALPGVERDIHSVVALIESSQTTLERLESTGVLKPEVARDLGVVGVAARASGVNLDVRRDHPYAAYPDLRFRVPVYEHGDVLHRMRVRVDEVRESIRLVQQAMAGLPEGPVSAPLPPLVEGRCGLSAVEGWRGEILHWVRVGRDGRLARCRVKDPSLNNWPALVEAVQGNIIPDFPVINKSFNLSYSGVDR